MPDTTTEALVTLEKVGQQYGPQLLQYTLSISGALLLLIGGFITARLLSRWLYRALGHVHGIDETLRTFLSNVVRYVVLVLVGVTVLAQFGVQTASILAALGAAGLAIGLALQGTLQNIAAGIMLLTLRPFRIGEYIEVGTVAGTVEDIGLFATRLRSADGLFVLAPNNSLWGTPVRNFSRNDNRRADLAVVIGAGADIDGSLAALQALVSADPRVLTSPAPSVFVSSLGEDDAVEVTARYWTRTADWWLTTRDLVRQARQRFGTEPH